MLSDEQAVRCVLPVFAAPGGKMSFLQVLGLHFCTSHVQKKKAMRKTLVANGVVQLYGGTSLLADLKFQEFSGQYKKFTQMARADFELLINLVSLKIVTRVTRLRATISVQERVAVTFRFLVTSDSYTHLQYRFQIFKQAIGQIVPEVCQVIVEAIMEIVQLKMCILRSQLFYT